MKRGRKKGEDRNLLPALHGFALKHNKVNPLLGPCCRKEIARKTHPHARIYTMTEAPLMNILAMIQLLYGFPLSFSRQRIFLIQLFSAWRLVLQD
jgi:hypothetical protein